MFIGFLSFSLWTNFLQQIEVSNFFSSCECFLTNTATFFELSPLFEKSKKLLYFLNQLNVSYEYNVY